VRTAPRAAAQEGVFFKMHVTSFAIFSLLMEEDPRAFARKLLLQKLAFASLRLKARKRKEYAAAQASKDAAATATAPRLPAAPTGVEEAVLRFELSSEELVNGRLHDATLAAVAAAVARAGVACIEAPLDAESLLPAELVAHCAAASEDYFFRIGSVGRKRSPGRWDIVNAALMDEPPFASRALRWNGFWAKLVRRLLGPACRMERLGVVFAKSGAADQGVHRDGKALFSDDGNVSCLPAHCLHVFVPLVDLTLENGPTEFFPGTHIRGAPPRVPGVPGITFTNRVLRAGSFIIFDFRVLHRGLRNASSAARPMLYFTFSRPWFRDDTNYHGDDYLISDVEEQAPAPERLT
jgi:ectoine hydroxylase-related dioxygenase (phytanoyl-CoA dioxygenase family)